MNDVPNPSMDRRSLLRNGGLMLSFGAIVAACGSDRAGSTAPGRLGVAPESEDLPSAEINDAVLLRTAQSLEYTAIDVYAAAAETGALSDDELVLVERFVADHQRHADTLAPLVEAAGGEPFECANPFLVERVVSPGLAALDGTDDLHRDVINIAYAFEQLAGASYQALVGALTDPALRSAAIEIGGEEQRHAAALATLINPDALINPELLGELAVDTDEMGFPTRYAVPATFGQVTGIVLTIGDVDDEGTRTSVTLQTPAANSMVYDYLSC